MGKITFNWYFLACAVAFMIIFVRSMTIKHNQGTLDAIKYRRNSFLVIAVTLFIIFIVSRTKILLDLDDTRIFQEQIAFGSTTAETMEELKRAYTEFDESDFNYVRRHYDTGDILIFEDDQEYAYEYDNNDEYDEIDKSVTVAEEEKSNVYIPLALSELTEIPEGYAQLPVKEVKASNYLKKYPPQMLIDGDIKTSWQVTIEDPEAYAQSEDLNEWIYFSFEGDKKIDYIVIYNGTPDSEKRYYKNGRVHELRLSDLSIDPEDSGQYLWTERLELKDEPVPLIIECKDLTTDELYFVFDNLYVGSDYPEMCITDVMFYSAEK